MSSGFPQLVFGFLLPVFVAGAVGWFLKQLMVRRARESHTERWQRRLEMAEHSTQHAEELARALRDERGDLTGRINSLERELAERTRQVEELSRNATEASSRARYLLAATRKPTRRGSPMPVSVDARLVDAEQETARSRLLLAETQRELTASTAHNQLLQSRLRTLRRQFEDLAVAHSALSEDDARVLEQVCNIRELETRLSTLRAETTDSRATRAREEKDRRIASANGEPMRKPEQE